MNRTRLAWLGPSLGTLLTAAVCLTGSRLATAGGFDSEVVNRCMKCHEEAANHFLSGNVHFKAWQARKDDKTYSCETCHGPGEKHMKEKSIESIISFSPEKQSGRTPQEQSKQCLSCHATQTKDLTFWNQGIHNRNDVTCAHCHTMHGGPEKMRPTSETCFKCHKEIKAQVGKYSHHPIIEGKVGCNDCHNPHGTMSSTNLRAESVNQLCYRCHADKRGPYLYEHPPVSENCVTCHAPHGSQHAKLLNEKMPALCQNCHDASSHPGVPWDARTGFGNGQPVGTPPYTNPATGPVNGSIVTSARFFGRSCVNCHAMIHGSNTPGTHGHALGR